MKPDFTWSILALLALQFPEWWGFFTSVKHIITLQKLIQAIILCKEDDTDLHFANGCELLQKKRKGDTPNCTTMLKYLDWLTSGKHEMITKALALFLVKNPLAKSLHIKSIPYPKKSHII